ncbi:gluconate 2-dehydrogenase subunit 3 family protein [Rhodohalobacter sp. 614A]|uniref:gluconate 2-dehydrogenase subunit 3 family protein n=1 Tax=Rhodohalobacter sp. 614A TaxID=2908649 RepID=UPI001F46F39D|nr:gluconate 2-dehydrogenase subunit 3 family protein [Rhodohalobacter sp. 614A]
MDNTNKIDRKEAIKRTAMIIGGAVFAPNILGILKGCTAQPGVDWNPVLFSNDQARLVTSLADVIIPADEYPSASEAGVPAFIESMINEVYTEEQRNEFLEGLDSFAENSRITLETDFFDSSDERRYEVVYNENQSALEIDRNESASFFLRFKELTILGYFTSEIGASEVLRYEAIPGMYDGCMPFEEIGKTWAV